jgi:hypothetical protein
MCTCATHCVESPYHERACCSETRCGCACHRLTADTITDEQVDRVPGEIGIVAARARCAETLNARRSS